MQKWVYQLSHPEIQSEIQKSEVWNCDQEGIIGFQNCAGLPEHLKNRVGEEGKYWKCCGLGDKLSELPSCKLFACTEQQYIMVWQYLDILVYTFYSPGTGRLKSSISKDFFNAHSFYLWMQGSWRYHWIRTKDLNNTEGSQCWPHFLEDL